MTRDWACLDCGALNAGHISACEACGEGRRRAPDASDPLPAAERQRWTPAPLEACVPVEQVRALIAQLTAQMGQEAPVKSTPASLAFAQRQLEYWRETHPEDLAEIGLLERKVERLKKAAWTAEQRREAGAEATERR